MFNFLEINKDDVKKVLKIVGEKDYKKASLKSPSKAALVKAFHKPDMSRVDFPQFRNYVESHIYDADDEINQLYCALLWKKMKAEYSYADELTDIIGNSEYKQLTDEQKDSISKYKDAYNAKPIIDSFDDYIKFLCMPSEEAINDFIDNKNEEIVDKLKVEFEKVKNEYNQLAKEYNDLVRKNKNLNNELEQSKKSNDSLEKSLTIENISFNLKSILPKEFKAKSFMDVYSELDRIEKNSMNNGDYELCNEVLAAKYAIAKLMKEGRK